MKVDSFAKRLDLIMKERNIKSVELANKTKIDKSAISNYLAGKYKPKPDKLIKLAEVLNVNENWLMGYDVPKERKDILLNEIESNALLLKHIVNLAKDTTGEELLIKCTMLNLDNQKKVLELINLYLKEQGDLYVENKD